MKNELEIKNMLDTVQQATNETVAFDEQAILRAYKSQEDNQSSIAIKVLSVIGGFVGTLAIVGFLLLTGLQSSEIGLLTTGIIFIVISILINKKSDKLILDTFSITAYVVGIFLLIFGLGEMDFNENAIAILVLIIALGSLFLTQNYIMSFVSILVVSGSLLMLLVFLQKTYTLIHLFNTIIVIAMTYVFLNEAKLIKMGHKLSKLYEPLRIGLVVSFILGLLFLRTRRLHELPINYLWIYSVILFIAILYVISKVLQVMQITNLNYKIGIYVLSAVLLVLTAFSPSILGAILLILLSFYVNYKFSFILGIVALIYFVSQYYYDLHYTLLTKSIMLFASGILFIALYLFTTKYTKNEKI